MLNSAPSVLRGETYKTTARTRSATTIDPEAIWEKLALSGLPVRGRQVSTLLYSLAEMSASAAPADLYDGN